MLTVYPSKKQKTGQLRKSRKKGRQSPQIPWGMRRKAGALVAALIIFAAGTLFSKFHTGSDNPDGVPAPTGAGYRVVRVGDGDSMDLRTSSGKKERIRLYGVDAPELHQKGGKAAADFAERLLSSKNVSLRIMDKDQYGRTVALVILQDGRVLNEEIVKAGHAWVYRAHCHAEPMCSTWYAHERQAKKEGRGLWHDNNPTPPWQWRRQNPRSS